MLLFPRISPNNNAKCIKIQFISNKLIAPLLMPEGGLDKLPDGVHVTSGDNKVVGLLEL